MLLYRIARCTCRFS